MKKATSVVDQLTQKRIAFGGMLMSHIGVLPESVVEKFSRNEFREEIPNRLLFAFSEEIEKTVSVSDQIIQPVRDNTLIFKWLTMWPIFCMRFDLKVELDFKALKTDPRILNRPQGFEWPVYKPLGFTARQAINILKNLGKREPTFTVWEDIPVEEYTSTEVRPSTHHLVLCRPGIEPDKEWRISANSMRSTSTPFMDHTERYLLEAFHWWMYKKGLDINTWTRCPRSRASRGHVASVGRDGSEFKAFWNYGDIGNPNGGGREVVIL